MASVIEELLLSHVIVIHINLNCYMWLMATVFVTEVLDISYQKIEVSPHCFLELQDPPLSRRVGLLTNPLLEGF